MLIAKSYAFSPVTCLDFNNTCWVNFDNGHRIGLGIVKTNYGFLKSEYGGGSGSSVQGTCRENSDGSVTLSYHSDSYKDFIEVELDYPYLKVLNLNFHADPDHNTHLPVKRLYPAPFYNCYL